MAKFTKRMEGELPPLKGSKIPKRFIFFDTETTVPLKTNDIREFKLILGVAIFIELDSNLNIRQKVVYQFKTIEEFIGIIQYHNRSKQMLHLFAHNIGFDIRVLHLPEEFNLIGYESEPPIINQMAFIWRVKSDRGTYLFLDTANLGVRSVGQLGQDLGFPKQDIDLTTANQEQLFEYCQQDVEILVKFVLEYIRYIDHNGLGSFKVTLASQALTAFRTRFMTTAPVIHNDQNAINLERKAYHGGRVECFRIGKQDRRNWFYVDVNSMYPAAMMGSDLPIQFLGYSESPRMKEFRIRMKNYYVIADVLIDTTEPVYPYMTKDKLLFPIGRFRTTLNHPELEYALKAGHILKVYASAQYKMGSLFESYVNFFYDEKTKHTKEGNKTQKTISKLYLNSLYGKFGQSEPHREEYCTTEFKGVYRESTSNVDTGEHYQYIAWYGKIYKEYKQGETTFSCPYIASAITAKARMLLWLYIKQAGRSNVAYCDTDSLVISAKGFRRLLPYVGQDRLGALKLEAQSKHYQLFGNKDYIFGEDTKHKGIPPKALKINQEQWEYLEFEGMLSWLNRGATGNPKGQFKLKQRRTEYNKGWKDADNIIHPFKLNIGESFDLVVCPPLVE